MKIRMFIFLAIIALAFAPGTTNAVELFLDSTIDFDKAGKTITLPLYKGMYGTDAVFYIITESSDRDLAMHLGVNWSPKLANALGTYAVQTVRKEGHTVIFKGTVDFSPMRVVIPGPKGFPPAVAKPGSIGDANYTPLITTGHGVVVNAPQVANSSGVHDSVAYIDYIAMQVTLKVVKGFYHGNEIFYISTDVSDFVNAALEESTFAPNMNAAPGIASGDPETSARAAIVHIVNGQTGVGNTERQGLSSAVLGEGFPLNVTEIHPQNQGEIPTYSPLWNVHPAVWTYEAIVDGDRILLDHHDDIIDKVETSLIISGGMGPKNHELGGLKAAGFIVNCPIMALD